MITKQTAALLFANSFKLVDKEGNEYKVFGLDETDLYVKNSNTVYYMPYSKIGADYFILRRDIKMLTETITHEGKEIIPIVELANIAYPEISRYWELYEEIGRAIDEYGNTFGFHSNSFTVIPKNNVLNQLQLFDTLHSYHFLPQLPDNLCKPLK